MYQEASTDNESWGFLFICWVPEFTLRGCRYWGCCMCGALFSSSEVLSYVIFSEGFLQGLHVSVHKLI